MLLIQMESQWIHIINTFVEGLLGDTLGLARPSQRTIILILLLIPKVVNESIRTRVHKARCPWDMAW